MKKELWVKWPYFRKVKLSKLVKSGPYNPLKHLISMEPTLEYPLISCICITENRPQMLLRTLISFCQQDYPNKELIISYPEKDKETRQLIEQIIDFLQINLTVIERLDTDSIGKARNDAISNCNGEYICMWDDDDLYQYTRLKDQFNSLQASEGIFHANILTQILLFHTNTLTQILLFHTNTDTAYLSFPSYWVCTLLCRKDHLLNHPCVSTNEFEYAPILNFLTSQNLLQQCPSNPALYTYVFHGKNQMNYTTFLHLVNLSYPVQYEISKNIKAHLNQVIEIPFNS